MVYEVEPQSSTLYVHKLKPTYILMLMNGNSGHAAISADESFLFTLNLKYAINIYSIPLTQHVQSLPHLIHHNVPLMVCSTFDGALTLAGSNNGSLRIFDQCIGTLAQSLPHGHGMLLFFLSCFPLFLILL
jgi:hypothetical protein